MAMQSRGRSIPKAVGVLALAALIFVVCVASGVVIAFLWVDHSLPPDAPKSDPADPHDARAYVVLARFLPLGALGALLGAGLGVIFGCALVVAAFARRDDPQAP